jgi:hypothetical protein
MGYIFYDDDLFYVCCGPSGVSVDIYWADAEDRVSGVYDDD